MNKILQNIIKDGGEGAVLRRVGSYYEYGTKSASLLKIKASLGDEEAVVVGVAAQNALQLQLPNGLIFTVPHDNVQLTAKPQIGDIVSFSYKSHSRRAEPVHPIVYRKREDLEWEHMNAESPRISKDFTTAPMNYWTVNAIRHFMETFAKKKGYDPKHADTWQHYISPRDIYNDEQGRYILKKLKGYVPTVKFLFPELQFGPNFTQHMWVEVKQRREFFINYAMENRFDPFDPAPWYDQPRETIAKRAHGVLSYHGGSVSRALLELFPEIGFDKSKFIPEWSIPENRRRFFEEYARENGFDPLQSVNWEMQPRDNILSKKGAHQVLTYYGYSIANALKDLFPGVHVEKIQKNSALQFSSGKLSLKSPPSWIETVESKRRKFFENYAVENGFDPLNPENWYQHSREKIQKYPGSAKVLFAYKNRVSTALANVFPDIGFDASKYQYLRHPS